MFVTMWLDIACALQQGSHDDKAHDLAAGEHQDGTMVVLTEGASADWASWLAARLSVRAFFDALGVPAERCHFDGFADRIPQTWSVYGIQRDAAAAEHACGKLWAEWQRTPAEPGASLVEICGRIGRVIERIPELELKLMPQWASFTGLSLRGDRLEIVQCGSNSVWRYDPEDETLRVLSPSDTIRGILRYAEQPGADPSGWLADFAPGGTTLEKLREMEPRLMDIGWRALGLKGGARLWTAQVKPGDVLLLCTKRVLDVQGAEQISPILNFAIPEGADVQSVAADIVMGAVREDDRYSYGAIIAVVRADGAPRRKRRPRSVAPATRTGKHDGEAVSAAQLIRRPLDYDRRRITTEGWLTYGFEHANFAGAEIELPRDFLQRCEKLPDRYVGYAGFVRVTEGTLTLGKYWLQLGPCAFLPPELTTSERGLSSRSETIPMHQEVVRWRERIEACDGVMQVRARGTVLTGGKTFSAYRVSMGSRSFLDRLRSTLFGK